jgi:uncharacterized SAM-binding protein YcdF (DUF218 family)
MLKRGRAWWFASGAVFILALPIGLGFLVFAHAATSEGAMPPPKADGIVALTGSAPRILVAARLLADGRARRLLVTGVNRQTTVEELRRLTGLDQRLFECCVDLGYEARNTTGNAEEARTWADAHRFSSLIVVTSGYHMPRSLAELGRVMPDILLIPYPVHGHRHTEKWWRSLGTLRVLVAEYVKFIPAAARFAVARGARALQTRLLAAQVNLAW